MKTKLGSCYYYPVDIVMYQSNLEPLLSLVFGNEKDGVSFFITSLVPVFISH